MTDDQIHDADSTNAASTLKSQYFDFTNYRFRTPSDWPKSVNSVKPTLRGGIGSIFQTSHMPSDARTGYWIWLVGCVLAIIAWVFSIAAILFAIIFSPATLIMTGMASFFGEIRWGVILVYAGTMLISLVMILIQLLFTLKIREGVEWARFGLTALTLLSIVYSIIITSAGLESGGAEIVTVNIISLLLVALFWLPKANDWFLRTTDEVGSAIRSDGSARR